MKAIKVEKFGPPRVMQLGHVKMTEISSKKVLVKVMAAGVNPVDTYIRDGAFHVLPKLPFTPGIDAAGLVHSVGANVTKFQAGQRVFMCSHGLGQHGTYAEYTAVDEEDVFPLDERLSYEEGAALGIPYFTAYRALVIKAKCVPGETVLIHGASGAVGLAAVQIAKNLKLKVFGTAGTVEGLDVVKKSGADHVFNHKEKNYMQNIMEVTDDMGVNVIIEMLADVNLDKDLDILSHRGRVIVVGCHGSLTLNPRKTMAPELEVIGINLFNGTQDEWKETSRAILEGIEEGWVKPVINVIYPLEKAFQAHEDIIHSKGAKGKLILSVQQP